MSTTLSPTLLVSLLVAGLIYMYSLFKQGKISGLKFLSIKPEGKVFGIAILSIGAFLSFRTFFSASEAVEGMFIFLVALNVPFFLRHFNFAPAVIQLILLFLVVLLSSIFGSTLPATALLSILLALLVNKLLENLVFSPGNQLEDIAPACVWLAVQSWLTLNGNNNHNVGNILLSCLSISLLLKLTPSTLLNNDRLLGKRIVLSLSAGLALLIILNNVLLLPKLAGLAVLFAIGIFFVYFFANESADKEDIGRLSYCVRFLVALGILTVIGTRLFGDLGLIVLLSTSLLAGGFNNLLLPSIFWSSRLLIQAFVSTYVSNITGINLMHTYCSAALYFGVLAILFLLATLSLKAKPWLALSIVLVTAILIPPAIIYLFHEESAASFLIASLVSMVSLISFFPLLYKGQDSLQQDNLMLVPMMMTTVGLLYGPLVQIGNEATVASRIQLISAIAVAFLVIYLVLLAVNRISISGKPVSISRD